MEYKNFSREQLLDRIESLEMLNKELLWLSRNVRLAATRVTKRPAARQFKL